MKPPSPSRWSLIVRAVSLVLLVAFAAKTEASLPAEHDPRKWPLEYKVGQLFMIGFPQTKIDADLRKHISERHPGGFILFRRNLKDLAQIQRMTKELRLLGSKSSPLGPLLAVDQEGGSVTRIPVFPALPSAYAIGAAGEPAIAEEIGKESGKILSWAGFNMNLAPVLDLSNPSLPSFIGPRSFGPNGDEVARMGVAYSKGLLTSGVLPTAKHFPGLGGTLIDLHKSTAVNTFNREQLQQNDLRPFESYAQLDSTLALMVSQMSYPALDESGMPAPFSTVILQDLLRKKMNFQGLIITDDLQMKGSSKHLLPADAALESLRAGADMVMISWSFVDQAKAVERVMAAIKKGEWSEKELDERVMRIVTVKAALAARSIKKPKIGRGPEGEPATKQLEKADLKLLDAKINRQNDREIASIEPMNSKKICTFSTYERFLRSFQQGTRAKVRAVTVTPAMSPKDLAQALRGDCPQAVVTLSGPAGVRLLRQLDADLRKKVTIVNLGLPLLTRSLKGYQRLIEIGFPHLHSGFRVAQIIEGGQKKTSVTTSDAR